MKKLVVLIIAMLFALSLCACGETNTSTEPEESSLASSETIIPETEETEDDLEDTTPITLTIGDTVLSGYLNNSAPAQSLIAQLPLTVTLNDSGNDFCGDSLDIEYSESDVQSGYKNGDLAFWPPASNFAIFVDGEENSANTGNLVILGRITEPQEALDALEGRIDVTIALAGESADAEETKAPISSETENTENSTIMNESEG